MLVVCQPRIATVRSTGFMSIVSHVYTQFEKPRGLLGRLAGSIMANRPSNIERNDWALSLLEITPTDRVLEIGFGPGIAAAKAAAQAKEVVGIDHSPLMVEAATRRNRDLVNSGKLKLVLGSVTDVDQRCGLFEKIYSVNVVQFWKDPVETFARLRGLLKSGGLLLTAYMPRHVGANDQDATAKGREIEGWLRQAGFSQIVAETKQMKPVSVVAVIARGD